MECRSGKEARMDGLALRDAVKGGPCSFIFFSGAIAAIAAIAIS